MDLAQRYQMFHSARLPFTCYEVSLLIHRDVVSGSCQAFLTAFNLASESGIIKE